MGRKKTLETLYLMIFYTAVLSKTRELRNLISAKIFNPLMHGGSKKVTHT